MAKIEELDQAVEFEDLAEIDWQEFAQRPELEGVNLDVADMEPTAFQLWMDRQPREELIRRGLLIIRTLQDANDVLQENNAEDIKQRNYRAWLEDRLAESKVRQERLQNRYWPEISRVWKKLMVKAGKKSTVLPAGKIGFRAVQDELVVDDAAKLIAWCRTNCPEALTLKIEYSAVGKVALEKMEEHEVEMLSLNPSEKDDFATFKVVFWYSKSVLNTWWKARNRVPDGCHEVRDKPDEFFVDDNEPKQKAPPKKKKGAAAAEEAAPEGEEEADD